MEDDDSSFKKEDIIDIKELYAGQTTEIQYYSLQLKIKILNYIKYNHVIPYKLSQYFDFKYSSSSIYKWKNNENLIRKSAKDKPKNKSVYPGKRINYEDIKEKFLEFISFNIKATIRTLVIYYDKMHPE